MNDAACDAVVVRRPRRRALQRRRAARRRRRRATLVALVSFAIVFGGVALAAGTPTTTASLATGTATADCQTAPISTDWGYGYDPTIPGYRVTAVLLDGLEPGCLSRGVRVAVASPSGAEIASGAGFTPASGTSAMVLLSAGVDLSGPWVGQLGVVIHS